MAAAWFDEARSGALPVCLICSSGCLYACRMCFFFVRLRVAPPLRGAAGVVMWPLAFMLPLPLPLHPCFPPPLPARAPHPTPPACLHLPACTCLPPPAVMLFGSDDGSIFVRHVSRIEGTGDINVRLLSVAAPSAKATTPSKVSCMWYESVR
jgi:hypothetical protein